MSTALAALTPRQMQVCELMLRGMSSKEIGRKLGLNTRTIEVYKFRMYRALGVNNALQFILKVLKEKESA